MARQLREGEAGVEGVRRILRKEIGEAVDGLGKRSISDTDIHETRKILKRTRAALRLVRKALGERAYAQENAAMRDAARPLSEIRDARILVDAFDAVVKRAAATDRRAWRPARASLVANQSRARRHVLGRRSALKPIVRKLKAARRRIDDWSAPRRGWRVISVGLERAYRAGRKAGARARSRPTVERLHEWRKQTKYLWHQLQLLEPIWPVMLRDLGDQAHHLSDLLGDDHDLAVLEQRLESSVRLRRDAQEKLAARIDGRRAALQEKALALGARLYEEPPSAFVGRLEGYWRAWRKEGRSKKQAAARGNRRRARPAAPSARRVVNGRAPASA